MNTSTPDQSTRVPRPRGRRWALTAALLALAAAGCQVAPRPESGGPSLLLAQNGAATMPIVISPKSSDATKAVAAELAGGLQRITGATFAVTNGDGSAGIVLGTLAEFPNPALDKPLEIRNGFDGKEAYAIRPEPGRLLLLGATDLGASHAAFRFLELVGCRWFFPAPEWEVVPAIPKLVFGRSETGRPAILARSIGYGYGMMRDATSPEDGRRSTADYDAWRRHNRMASSLKVNAGHAWQAIIAANKAEFDRHPEYYALVNGERKPSEKFEVANPAVRKMVVDYALNFFRKYPDADMVSLEPSDGGGQSESEESKKLGSFSDQVFGLANEAARAVQQEFPGKMVGLYAYGWHSDPPAFDLEPNVHVERIAGFTYSKIPGEQLMELWSNRCRHLGWYEYFSVWLWDWDLLPGGRGADVSYLQKTIKLYTAHHAASLTAESGNNWGPHGRGYYIANQLMWNPDADVPALLADFYQKAFGPAAPAMQRYYERVDPGQKPLVCGNFLALAFRDVEEAARLAKDRPDVQARLDQIKQYLRYNHLHWLLERAKTKEDRQALTLAILTHCYRTRYSYMNHWEAMRQWWTGRAAKEFDEPTWSFADPSPDKPWRVKTAPTHEETEAQFREGLAYFQPQPVTERTFSTDLVPVEFAGGRPVASQQGYQFAPRYAFYSLAGEPLEMDIQTGLIPVYRSKPDARYTLTDGKKKIIAQGQLPLDPPENRHLKLEVPQPGQYFFDFNDSGAGWNIKVAADRRVCVALARDKELRSLGVMQAMYFYVPKGTKQIVYYFRGGPHDVAGPDGKAAQKVDVNSDLAFVPVPAGQDGKVWCLSGLRPVQLLFLNVPNYLAASPQALLVPREVAQADGLTIANPGTTK